MQYLFVLVIGILSSIVFGIYVIPERGEITYKNDSYIKGNVTFNVRKTRRGGIYVVNAEFIKTSTWTNNVSADVDFFEFLHNEYRPTFINMHFKFCDLINKDNLIGPTYRKAGFVCPHTSNLFSLRNASLNVDFPFKWPFEKCKVTVTTRLTHGKDVLITADLYMRIVNNSSKAQIKP